MTTITIATSKGGAGKTTLALAIAGTLANRGHRVAAIDADYNHSLADWVGRFHAPITVEHELDETKVIPLARVSRRRNDLLVIDTAGAAMQATVFAIGCADLVLIPCQLSSSDVLEAAKTAQLVDSASSMTRRTIPARVVLTDYQPHTTIAQHVESELAACQLTPLSDHAQPPGRLQGDDLQRPGASDRHRRPTGRDTPRRARDTRHATGLRAPAGQLSRFIENE